MFKSSILLCLCTVLIVSGEIVKNVPEPPASDERTVQKGNDISRDAKGILFKNDKINRSL